MTRRTIAASAFGVLLSLASVAAQDPPPPPVQPGQQRQNQPVVRPNAQGALNPNQIQDHLDGWAIVQAQSVLQLTEEQAPNFVARYVRVQRLRRQFNQERIKMMREMRPLLQGPGPYREDVLAERLKALDDLTLRSADEIRKALVNLDGVLGPVQRARFRFFEEEVERRKIELLGVVNQGRGRGVAPQPPPGGRGGGTR